MAHALGNELADQCATDADFNAVNAKIDSQARIANIVLAGVGLMVALGLVQTATTMLAR